jgi:aminopeptidase
MHDSRIDSLARQLIRYSTKVKKGDRVMLDIYDAPNSVTLALIRQVVAAKAFPW